MVRLSLISLALLLVCSMNVVNGKSIKMDVEDEGHVEEENVTMEKLSDNKPEGNGIHIDRGEQFNDPVQRLDIEEVQQQPEQAQQQPEEVQQEPEQVQQEPEQTQEQPEQVQQQPEQVQQEPEHAQQEPEQTQEQPEQIQEQPGQVQQQPEQVQQEPEHAQQEPEPVSYTHLTLPTKA